MAGRRERIARYVESVLDRLDPAAPVDIVADVAEPVVVPLVCELLGLPAEDGARCAAWTADLGRMAEPVPAPGVRERVETALTEFRARPETLIAQNRIGGLGAELLDQDWTDGLGMELLGQGRTDGLGAESPGQNPSHGLPPETAVANLVMLAMAATDTTVSQLALAVLALLRHPGQLAAAVADPALAERAAAEFARYDGPVHIVTRRPAEPLSVAGVVMLCLAAASRDPGHCADPDRLDLSRTDVASLPFGAGPHYCLGSHLGRLVTGTTLAGLLRRFPSLSPARPLDALTWRPSVVSRRPQILPVLLGRTGRSGTPQGRRPSMSGR